MQDFWHARLYFLPGASEVTFNEDGRFPRLFGFHHHQRGDRLGLALLESIHLGVALLELGIVPAKGGEPLISPHLKELRPFLTKGDFAPGSWGHRLVDALQPADLVVEKIAYSAFFMTRLEWVLRKCAIERLLIAGIVTNGGVASTAREAHVRDFETTVLDDGCAAFSPDTHDTAIEALRPVCRVARIDEVMAELGAP